MRLVAQDRVLLGDIKAHTAVEGALDRAGLARPLDFTFRDRQLRLVEAPRIHRLRGESVDGTHLFLL